MIIVNTDFIPGYRIVEVVGLAKGSSVRGASIGTDISAWFKNQVGGEIEEYTKMLAESREQALDRLIEHARTRGRIKRGANPQRVSLDVDVLAREAQPEEITAVDDAIRRLEQKDPRMGKIVQLRFFVGLSVAETAAALRLSDRTVRREWALARAWLSRELKDD